MDDDEIMRKITIVPVPGPHGVPADGSPLPLDAGYVEMAYPPNGPTMVVADEGRDGILRYRRVRVRQCEPTAAEDFWCDDDEEIPGEYEEELAIGDDFRTRDVADFLAWLRCRSPVQYARLLLTVAAEVCEN